MSCNKQIKNTVNAWGTSSETPATLTKSVIPRQWKHGQSFLSYLLKSSVCSLHRHFLHTPFVLPLPRLLSPFFCTCSLLFPPPVLFFCATFSRSCFIWLLLLLRRRSLNHIRSEELSPRSIHNTVAELHFCQFYSLSRKRDLFIYLFCLHE